MQCTYHRLLFPIHLHRSRISKSSAVKVSSCRFIRRNMVKIYGCMAADPEGVVGKDGKLPWNYPDEFEHFKSTTRGHVMIMGRKTFVDTPVDVLQQTTPIVFSRNREHPCFKNPEVNCTVVSTLHELVPVIESVCNDNQKIYMIGGGELAKIFFKANVISEFILTKIHKSYPGDSYLDIHHMKDWNRTVLKETQDYTIYSVANPTPDDLGALYASGSLVLQ